MFLFLEVLNIAITIASHLAFVSDAFFRGLFLVIPEAFSDPFLHVKQLAIESWLLFYGDLQLGLGGHFGGECVLMVGFWVVFFFCFEPLALLKIGLFL